MAGGKNRKQTVENEVKLDPDIKRAAMEQLDRAKRAAAIGPTPNFGPTVAAFTPMQLNAMESANTMARAFGMPTAPVHAPKGEWHGGVKGISIKPYYDASMSAMPEDQRQRIEEFMALLRAGNPATSGNTTPSPDQRKNNKPISPIHALFDHMNGKQTQFKAEPAKLTGK